MAARTLRPVSNGTKHSAPKIGESEGMSDEEVVDLDALSDDSASPKLLHRFVHNCSILAIAIASKYIYAATQAGEILVFALDTYERVAVIEGHVASVLGLCLSEDKRLLFSSAADRVINVWNANTFHHVASIYSTYDLGDVFCVSYSSKLETIYLGAQNTSIQWCGLRNLESLPASDPHAHPFPREDKFFDSPGPGGTRILRPANDVRPRDCNSGRNIEIGKDQIQQFAHFGFVYCTVIASGASFGAPFDEILISGGGDGVIKLWSLDADDGGSIREIGKLDDERQEGDSVLTIILDGTLLYAGRVDGEINVWDLETMQFVRTVKSDNGDILSLAVGRGLMFSADIDGMVKKFDQRHELIKLWKAHNGRVLASSFIQFRDRYVYVTGGNDDTVAVWDISDCHERPLSMTKTGQEQLLESLRHFVSFRTVSANPIYKSDCRRGASYLRSVLKKVGASTELLKTEDGYNPLVFARFKGNPATSGKRKKILFYGHYDVIRAENLRGKWNTEPFTMAGINGFLYGRGVSDNKGPVMAAIYAVAGLVERQQLDSDIVFLIEGEEECGSRGFRRAIKAHKKLIGDIDWILLANSYWLDDEEPCLTYGLRGLIQADVEIESDEPDLHSGVDGSRLLDEPLKDLVMLLARLSGPHGRVEIPGFYDTIRKTTKDEERLYHEISDRLLARNPDLGTPESLISSLVQRWSDATLTIHNFTTSGPFNPTVIPQHAKSAISIRLVPNQEVEEVAASLVNFLESEFAKFGSKNKLTVTINRIAEPWLGDYRNQLFQMLEAAVMEVWQPANDAIAGERSSAPKPSRTNSMGMQQRSPTTQKLTQLATSSKLAGGSNVSALTSPTSPKLAAQVPFNSNSAGAKTSRPGTADSNTTAGGTSSSRKPLYIREGGSIPAIRFLEKEFGAPAAHLPCGLASDNAHLDNERFRVLNLWKSVDIFTKVFRDLPGK